ncbi:MAG: hypothetical protein EBT83_00400, partial [Betaproteobacteria bacterium]|nr:hypothetical protein [Betaproteobacteria bacterium]
GDVMKLKAISIAAAALGWGLAGAAQAVILLPGGGPLAVPTVGSAFGGTVLATTSGTMTTTNWSGNYRVAVVDGPEAGPNMDFYYQLSNNSNSRDAVGRLTGADFLNQFTTDVYQTAAGGFAGCGVMLRCAPTLLPPPRRRAASASNENRLKLRIVHRAIKNLFMVIQ